MRRPSCRPLHHVRIPSPSHVALACLTLLGGPGLASAQAPSPQDDPDALDVVVTAPALREPRASITGLGDTPGWQAPLQAQSFRAEALKNVQVQRLADLVKLDASTSDAYNTTGYWDYLSIRGFQLDNAYNYRREGLPINAETRLALDNKAAVELFKGTSGIQAGVSAPGGLVNLLVKRPEGRVRQVELGLTGGASVMAAVDLSDRFGENERFGLRVNAAAERLAPDIENARGHRRLLAVATDWRLNAHSLLEAEFEHSVFQQPSVPGFSLTGSAVPSANDFDPAHNLNQQPWSQPVNMRGTTGTLRWRQRWAAGWESTVTYGEQRLRSDDRAAFPSGCFAQEDYTRYCSDGSFDLYDYRSENERRTTRALQAQLKGQAQWGAVRHELTVAALRALHTTGLQTAAFNYAGGGQVNGPIPPYEPSAEPTFAGTNRRERSTELSVADAITFHGPWRAWAGVRHTALERRTKLTDGSIPTTPLSQSVTTAWGALGYQLAERTQAYLSWGEGFEARVAMGNPLKTYSNQGEVLPVRKSRQWELGVKAQHSGQQWGVNWFSITRPEAGDVEDDGLYRWDGESRHQGLEGYWQAHHGAWTINASAMVIDAERSGSQDSTIDGRDPVNVPAHTLKLSAAHRWNSPLPWTLQADLVHEGPRWADEGNEARIPSWTRVDVSVRALQRLGNAQAITWRMGVANVFDRRAWREAPTLTGHIYLFPLQARTLTASAQMDF